MNSSTLKLTPSPSPETLKLTMIAISLAIQLEFLLMFMSPEYGDLLVLMAKSSSISTRKFLLFN